MEVSRYLTEELEKDQEIVIKSGKGRRLSIDLVDYRAFISIMLILLTAFLAYNNNLAWREFALMTGMAIAWWFGKRSD
jgi:hypothetical protein